MTYIIKEDLNSLNQQIAKLQEVAKLQKAAQNNIGRKHLLSHESSVVLSLQSKLANMSNEFKLVLEIRTKVSFYSKKQGWEIQSLREPIFRTLKSSKLESIEIK